MGRKFISLILLMVISASSTVGADAEEIPAYWRKTMTNDPQTNFYLAESLKPLPNKDAETLKVLRLSLIAGNLCLGAAIDTKTGDAFLRRAGYNHIRGKTWDEAAFLADDWFKYFNYRSLAHLCAGIDYIFGPEGKLVPNLVKPGKGEPKASYDPQNPYLRLPPLRKPNG
ncbi:hypothetical protein GR223_32430 [Rhizobium leguminosarum]|uniref:hypothetical protein n=1 Tax=Rhizobium ruizarguesonis TaxID=2081791 RepID=UPI0010318AC5|nr:hypothetical protein [Rhizobium ruizarguesonis]NEJ90593.1 hypothetical protein [Rhizobium ruizarguesonis]NEJ94482.1 hypothetical protein [Rhizobium ruizarguesonis]TAT83893.1 hypothetical protein ELI52_10570 [Rhizobium ruizarguesonis]TAU31538.1 hypothetical protein ELI47_10900 [Rhizobium ruizarguesonis]TAW21699.1 hypothetical protein ELI20_11105 [Rhizobium ruizarguesonis]